MTPSCLITAVLDDVGSKFPDMTKQNVSDLVSHGEPGVALSILCSQILEYEIQIGEEDRSRLEKAANIMGIPLSELDGM